jgi:hypothetical protein
MCVDTYENTQPWENCYIHTSVHTHTQPQAGESVAHTHKCQFTHTHTCPYKRASLCHSTVQRPPHSSQCITKAAESRWPAQSVPGFSENKGWNSGVFLFYIQVINGSFRKKKLVTKELVTSPLWLFICRKNGFSVLPLPWKLKASLAQVCIIRTWPLNSFVEAPCALR